MANIITNKHWNTSEVLPMRNGLTSVVISLLALNGSALAATDAEKELVVWLASHDQNCFGIGAVGFDLSDIPWTTERFEAEKSFLLNVIRRAKSKQDWVLLRYEPREDWVYDCLEMLHQMISHFFKEYINPRSALNWQVKKPATFIVCQKHGVLHHLNGCVVCNDE
jgi:hypothetical protein